MTTLNEDIFTLIYSHVFDFDIFCATAIAIAAGKHHPLRNVVLRRFLQLPLCLSSKNLDDSSALIDYLVRNTACAGLVRDIKIILGPSRSRLAEFERFGQMDLFIPLQQAEKAEVLANLLPELLRHTGNLQRLDWSNYPPL